MALKINTQIGTDRGITSEAYVRIQNYNISKNGNAVLQLQLFLDETSALVHQNHTPIMMSGVSNKQIGENLYLPLSKEVSVTETKIRTVLKPVEVEVEVSTLDENGQPVVSMQTQTHMQNVEESYEETTVTVVPDLSVLESDTVFEFGYGKLKEHLSALFGAENIIDC